MQTQETDVKVKQMLTNKSNVLVAIKLLPWLLNIHCTLELMH